MSRQGPRGGNQQAWQSVVIGRPSMFNACFTGLVIVGLTLEGAGRCPSTCKFVQIGRKADSLDGSPGRQSSAVRRAKSDLDESEKRARIVPYKKSPVPTVPSLSHVSPFRVAKPLVDPPAQQVEIDEVPEVDYVEVLATQAKLQALTNVAQNLNELSDRLTAQVAEIEGAINKLNLGVRASVDAEIVPVDENASRRVIFGYDKVSGKWGFVISQYLNIDPENTYEQWAFKDAPRELRLKVIECIPLLLDDLVTKSMKLASEITGKITVAKNLVSSLSQSSPAGPRK